MNLKTILSVKTNYKEITVKINQAIAIYIGVIVCVFLFYRNVLGIPLGSHVNAISEPSGLFLFVLAPYLIILLFFVIKFRIALKNLKLVLAKSTFIASIIISLFIIILYFFA